jgi:hypothetical protein
VKLLVVIVFTALLAASCDPSRERLHVVYAIDLSASIEARAVEAAFDAANGSLRSLDRGDAAAVIPIVSDDLNDAEGRILRYRLGSDRRPYDGDLRRLAAEEKQALAELREATMKKPSPKTDILGAVDLAAEEFNLAPKGGLQVLVVLSDFLQDDARYRFGSDRELADPKLAEAFARQLAGSRPAHLDGVRVFLGALASTDIARLSHRRREAVRAFWMTYLRDLGADVRWATDGSGMVDAFLADARFPREGSVPSNGPATGRAILAQLYRFAW